jgi:hypothetical protein
MTSEFDELLNRDDYNFKNPQDVERYFLVLNSELLSVSSNLAKGYQDFYDRLIELDLYTLPEHVLKSLSDVFFSLHNYSGACYNYFKALVAVRGVEAESLS